MITYIIIIFFFHYTRAIKYITNATIHSLDYNFVGNCLFHGNESNSRQTSHGIKMYRDERIKFTISVGRNFPFNCGSCILINLENDFDKIYLNNNLTIERKNNRVIYNQFIGIVIDIVPDYDIFLLNTYLKKDPIQNNYLINYIEHPCPFLDGEYNEFLFCSSIPCHNPNYLFTKKKFKYYYNEYYLTIHPRNFRYNIILIKLFYDDQYFEYLQVTDENGYLMPSHLKYDKFYLECTDTVGRIFQYLFSLDEILNSNINLHYHGGTILYKKSI